MKNKLKLDIVSQDKRLLTEEVDSVNVMTSSGEITVLPDHTPLLAKLSEGILTYRIDAQESYVAIFGGFIEVSKDNIVSVLADSATRAENIEIAKVEAAKAEAEEALKDPDSDRDLILAEASLRRAALEIKTAHKLKSN